MGGCCSTLLEKDFILTGRRKLGRRMRGARTQCRVTVWSDKHDEHKRAVLELQIMQRPSLQ